MTQFLIEGGIIFMSILTLLFLLILGLSVFAGISIFNSTSNEKEKIHKLVDYIWSIALFTLAFAILIQILGLVDVFDYLANTDANVTSSIIAKGIKLTFHPTLYGLIIYLTSTLIVLGLKFKISKPEN